MSATALQSQTSSLVSDVTRLSHDVIRRCYDVIAKSLNKTSVYSVVEMGEEFYPADVDGMMYTIVLVIQV